ncbi:MAG: hypothetical protein ACOCV2_13960 [Persicimonas sp.]
MRRQTVTKKERSASPERETIRLAEPAAGRRQRRTAKRRRENDEAPDVVPFAAVRDASVADEATAREPAPEETVLLDGLDELVERDARPAEEPDEETKAPNQRRERVAPTIVQRALRHPWLMPYNRLAVGVTLLNAALFYALAESVSLFGHGIEMATIANIVLANFAVAIVIRLKDVINLLFRVATSAPTDWPLSVRWALGKVYHFGGIHVGCFFSGALWMGLLLATSMQTGMSSTFTGMLGAHVDILGLMILTALPQFRHRFHNTFEVVGRFGTWISLALFWAQTLHFVQLEHGALGFAEAASTWQVWVLAGLTFVVALPWMRLRKVPVDVETPSDHAALANFDFGIKPFAGSSTQLSRNPLFEWHSFANVTRPDEDGFQLTISRAGDWTGEFIDDPPDEIWVKALSAAGVGNVETLFDRVLWVATGSGIGPCLPHLLRDEVPADLLWVTKAPRDTYGDELVDEILDEIPDAHIWNTDASGRPDLVEEAFNAYDDSDAEAVICISNKPTTFELCHEFESHGVPAFGAIWDS